MSLFSNKKVLIAIGIVVFIIIAILLAMVFNRPKQIAVVVQSVPVELTWWSTFGPEVYQEIIDDFKKIPGNEQVTIKIVKIDYNNGEDYYKDLVLEYARDTAPDIFTLKNDDLPAWRELLTPIKDVSYLPNSTLLANYRSDFVDLVAKDAVFRDEIYGATAFVDNIQLFYNKALLEQAGIPLLPQTWTDLESQLNLLNRRLVNNQGFSRYGISMGTGLNVAGGDLSRDSNVESFYDIIPALIFQNGGQIYDTINNQSIFAEDKNKTDLESGKITDKNFDDSIKNNPALSALKFYTDFSDPASSWYSWPVDAKSNVEAFLEGRLAFLLNYSGFNDTIKERNNRLRYGVAEIPQLDKEIKKTYGYFFAEVLNKNLETKALANPTDLEAQTKLKKARELLYFLLTSEAQQKFIAKTNLPAARRNILEQQLSGDEYLRYFALGSLYSDNYYKPDVKKIEAMWGNLLYKYHYQNIPLEEALKQSKEEYNLLVQQGAKIKF